MEAAETNRVILLVEDDPNDVFFFERALEDIKFPGQLRHFSNTDGAKEYLKGAGEYGDRALHPFPELVVADSAISARGTGVELLEWMRAENLDAQPPFVIFSGDVDRETRARAEAAGVKLVLTKASDFRKNAQRLREMIAELTSAK